MKLDHHGHVHVPFASRPRTYVNGTTYIRRERPRLHRAGAWHRPGCSEKRDIYREDVLHVPCCDLLCQVIHAINTCSRSSFALESEDQNFPQTCTEMYGSDDNMPTLSIEWINPLTILRLFLNDNDLFCGKLLRTSMISLSVSGTLFYFT